MWQKFFSLILMINLILAYYSFYIKKKFASGKKKRWENGLNYKTRITIISLLLATLCLNCFLPKQ